MTNPDKKWGVGVVGLGRVGSATYRQLRNVEGIERIYLFTGNEGKGEHAVKSYLGTKPIKINARSYDDIPRELDTPNNIDIMILAVAGEGYAALRQKGTYKGIRQDILEINIGWFERYGKLIQGHDDVHHHIITNSCDEGCYIASSWSGVPTEYFTGQQHIDMTRTRTIMRKVFADKGLETDFLNKIRVATIGPHSPQVVPIFLNLAGLPLKEISFLNNAENYALLRQAVVNYAFDQIKRVEGTGIGTEDETAQSVVEVVEAIMNEYTLEQIQNNDDIPFVSTSLFIPPRLVGIRGAIDGLFFGYPTRFEDLKAIPMEGIKIMDDDRRLIAEAYWDLEARLMDFKERGIINRYIPV